ncbi:MAG: DUF4156 domain-containing protein [Dokdonella sp.]|nr:DUF4156 domain-containing protein [Dokdonella sp.]
MRGFVVSLSTALALAACSWGIRLDSGGRNVQTVWTGNVSGCVDKGRVTVSVLDHVGPVNRRDLKVRDELEVLARNEAASIGADTIQPLGEPRDGEQAFAAWHCGRRIGNAATVRPSTAPRDDAGAVQTYPIKD